MKCKTTALMAAMLVMAGTAAMDLNPAFAEEKINRISVNFKIEGYDEYGYPEIEADVSASAHYSCGAVELEADEMDDDYGTKKAKSAAEENYVIEFTAEDGYAFYLTKADQIRLNGAGAKYVKASRLDHGTTLRLTFQLTRLEDVCGPVEQVRWNGDGTVSWSPSYNAVKYKLCLSRNNGSSKVYYTGGTRMRTGPTCSMTGQI